MRIARMNLWSKENNPTRAFFDVETEEGITIKGFKIVEGSKGFFMGVPSNPGKDGKFYESVYIPRELKDEFEKLAITEYAKLTGQPSGLSFEKDQTDPPF